MLDKVTPKTLAGGNYLQQEMGKGHSTQKGTTQSRNTN